MANPAGAGDTSPQVLRLQYERFRAMSPAEKLRLVSELTRTANRLALAGLAHRYPGADQRELLLRLAVQRLGAEVVATVTGGGNRLMVPEGLPEPVELALQFTALLDRLDIPYLIVGSLASSVHGEARTTADIDLVLDLKAHQISGLVAGLGSDYYVSEPALQEAVRRGGTANLIHLPSALKLDLFVAGSDPFDRERLRTRQRLELSPGRAAWIDLPEHTLVRKLDWYRRGSEVSDRQWRDILGILRAQGTRLDQGLLDTWATRLGVSDLLARARTEAKLDG